MSCLEMMKDDESGLPKEVAEELDEALLSLAGKSREMIVMRFFEGAGYGKVAGQFGLTEEAARKRMTRALDKLRDVLLNRGSILEEMSSQDLIREIQRISDGPQHALSAWDLEALLEQISNEEMAVSSAWTVNELSSRVPLRRRPGWRKKNLMK
jgi:hypothetical protein